MNTATKYLEKMLKVIFSYPAITIGTGVATGVGIWHATRSDEDHVDGYTATFAGLNSDEYRQSFALTTVFTQFSALSYGLMYGREHGSFSTTVMGVNYLVFLGLLGTWIGYIFDEKEDAEFRTAVIALSATFSAMIFLVSLWESIYGNFFSSPIDAKNLDTSTDNRFVSFYRRLPYSPIFTRGLALAYLLSTVVYMTYGNAIEETAVLGRDPRTAFTNIETTLLHEEDQWKNIMFIASLFALFTLGMVLAKAELADSTNRDPKRHHRGALVVVVGWIVVVVLECVTAFTHQGHKHYTNLLHWTGVFHLVFAFLIAVVINDNALRFGQSYQTAKVSSSGKSSGGYTLMGYY